ncbi:MAG: cytochrome C [Acidimicrobiia bacterium]|nr:cytochrome C [Acidimicrobiia bacterium]
MTVLLTGVVLLIPLAASGQEAGSESDAQINDYCLSCHESGNIILSFPSGELLPAALPRTVFEASIHGQEGLTCIDCHTDIGQFPHDPMSAVTRRDLSIELYTSCFNCHESAYTDTLDNMHNDALAGGNREAAICTDCHGAHNVTHPSEDTTAIPRTCRNCHSEIYDLYASSVHGDALIEHDNADVPSCTDCHGVHSVEGPSHSQFHLFSPTICENCHADDELMGKYGISTEVFDTYVADFHGTTVMLFEELAPDQETNSPVCIDCHGVHNILAADAANSTVFKENLLVTCQRCHPDATANFPDSWMKHYQPTSDQAVLVWLVNWFYRLAIPGVVGGMLIWVTIDWIRHLQRRRKAVENV